MKNFTFDLQQAHKVGIYYNDFEGYKQLIKSLGFVYDRLDLSWILHTNSFVIVKCSQYPYDMPKYIQENTGYSKYISINPL